ncbi:hypothetical protein M8J77_020484 [Diaphorina citri]|nr:hypothetical protein M8J77_020484 [Diaphorina citri]
MHGVSKCPPLTLGLSDSWKVDGGKSSRLRFDRLSERPRSEAFSTTRVPTIKHTVVFQTRDGLTDLNFKRFPLYTFRQSVRRSESEWRA